MRFQSQFHQGRQNPDHLILFLCAIAQVSGRASPVPASLGIYLLTGKANPGKHKVLNNLYSPARIINNQLVWFMFPKYISCYRQD
jgi:hypothetical protein